MVKNILIACDKFKGSLSADRVCTAIEKGLKTRDPLLNTTTLPIADGGDGSLDIISQHVQGRCIEMDTVDPLGRALKTYYLLSGRGAYIELSLSSGIALLGESERNVMTTNTRGTGIMIRHAIDHGADHIVLFAGGSATNDAGLGIAHALGCTFYDEEGIEVMPRGDNLRRIQSAKVPNYLHKIKFEILSDVTNPMYGEQGAAQVYARQKCADAEEIRVLDEGLRKVSEVLKKQFGRDAGGLVGGGSAGGLAGGLFGLLDAQVKNGFEAIADMLDIEEKIKNSDFVISGEGKLDEQSIDGKVVGSVLKLCKKYNKPLVCYVGMNDLNNFREHGIEEVHTIMSVARDYSDALKNSEKYLEQLARNGAYNFPF